MGPMQRWSWDKCRYGEELLSKIAGRGVQVPVTRTIGMDHIGLDAAARLGIAVGNARYASDSVALHAHAHACGPQALQGCGLPAERERLFAQRARRQDALLSCRGHRRYRRHRRCCRAEALRFGCKILAAGHHANPEVAKRAAYVSQDELFRASDVISFHAPATPANHHLVSCESLAEMKDGVVLVNTARPDPMDVSALTEGIEVGKIGALAMDVFEGKQGICHINRSGDILRNRDMACLRQLPNTVLTQHMAFCMAETVEEMVETAVAKAHELFEGRNA